LHMKTFEQHLFETEYEFTKEVIFVDNIKLP